MNTLSDKEIDEHRLNSPTEPIEHGKCQYNLLLDCPEDLNKATLRIYNSEGARLFSAHFGFEEWQQFVGLVLRFNDKYTAYIEKVLK